MRDRKNKVLKHLNTKGLGIEIGPSHNPVAPKRDGYNVHIIDHMSRAELKEKYAKHPVNLDAIEEVDFVWKGESYAELTGKRSHYDWIIASHLIEHTPDLIGFLNDCASILKDNGVLSLVIPDKRYCFDRFRPITGISRIIDNHLRGEKIHTPGTVAEYFLNVVARSGAIAWEESTKGDYNLIHPLEMGKRKMNEVVRDKSYIDLHAWCFTPNSFRLIINDLFSLGLTPLKEVAFYPTDQCEFYVALSRNGAGLQCSRMDLLKTIEIEIGNQEFKSR